MLSRIEKRFVKTPTSLVPRNRTYIKRQLEKKIIKTAEDIGLLIDNGYDVSEIINSIRNNSDIRVKRIIEQILEAQKILNMLGDTKTIESSESHKKEDTIDSKKPDSIDDDKKNDENSWDM